MTNVKLKATLPKDDENNGLGKGAAEEFIGNPRKPQVAIVVLQTEEITKSLASGEQVPKVAILRVELIPDAEEAGDLIKRAQALSEERTGLTPLPGLKAAESSALDFDDEPEVDYDAMHADDFDPTGGDAA